MEHNTSARLCIICGCGCLSSWEPYYVNMVVSLPRGTAFIWLSLFLWHYVHMVVSLPGSTMFIWLSLFLGALCSYGCLSPWGHCVHMVVSLPGGTMFMWLSLFLGAQCSSGLRLDTNPSRFKTMQETFVVLMVVQCLRRFKNIKTTSVESWHETRDIHPMLIQYWTSFVDYGPALYTIR